MRVLAYQVQVASDGETSCRMPWPKLGSLHTQTAIVSSSVPGCLDVLASS